MKGRQTDTHTLPLLAIGGGGGVIDAQKELMWSSQGSIRW